MTGNWYMKGSANKSVTMEWRELKSNYCGKPVKKGNIKSFQFFIRYGELKFTQSEIKAWLFLGRQKFIGDAWLKLKINT